MASTTTSQQHPKGASNNNNSKRGGGGPGGAPGGVLEQGSSSSPSLSSCFLLEDDTRDNNTTTRLHTRYGKAFCAWTKLRKYERQSRNLDVKIESLRVDHETRRGEKAALQFIECSAETDTIRHCDTATAFLETDVIACVLEQMIASSLVPSFVDRQAFAKDRLGYVRDPDVASKLKTAWTSQHAIVECAPTWRSWDAQYALHRLGFLDDDDGSSATVTARPALALSRRSPSPARHHVTACAPYAAYHPPGSQYATSHYNIQHNSSILASEATTVTPIKPYSVTRETYDVLLARLRDTRTRSLRCVCRTQGAIARDMLDGAGSVRSDIRACEEEKAKLERIIVVTRQELTSLVSDDDSGQLRDMIVEAEKSGHSSLDDWMWRND